MKAKIFILVVCVICGLCIHTIKHRQYANTHSTLSGITLANLNALTGDEETIDDGEKDNGDVEKGNDGDVEKGDNITNSEFDTSFDPIYYQSMHFPVYNSYLVKTGKCTASCYQSPTSKNTSCHKHAAKECCHE